MITGVTFLLTESRMKRGLPERLMKGGLKKNIVKEGREKSAMIPGKKAMTPTSENLMTIGEKVT